MGFVDDYQRDVWNQHKLLPQYPPSGGVRVGDVMEKRDGVWKLRSNITSSGFKPKTAKSKPLESSMSVSSKGSLRMTTKVKGSAPAGAFKSILGEADAGVHLTFTKTFGYALAASGITETAMTNVDQLVDHIVKTQRWNWDLSFLIVTETYQAETTTLVASSTKGATTVLKAKADIKPGGIKVAELAASFDVVASTQLDGQWIGEKNLTPLYGVKKVRLIDVLLPSPHGDRMDRITGKGQLRDLAIDELTLPTNGRFSAVLDEISAADL